MRQRAIALWRLGATDPSVATRVLGVLYLAGATLVSLSVLLPHPAGTIRVGLWSIIAIGITFGSAAIAVAPGARDWVPHALLAFGTTCISLCVFFAGVAAGVYSSMFVWVVLVAASFFSGRQVAAHVLWIVVSWGIVLGLVEASSGFSSVTRWILGSFVLVVTAFVMTGIVSGRRKVQEQLTREIDQRLELQSQLEHLANHDPLTGLANRRAFEQQLAREMSRASRHSTPLCLVVLDLNGFKDFNDTYGHAAGDRRLRSVAASWKGALRLEDLIARVGGDEFVAILPDSALEDAERAARRLQIAADGVSVSCGIAQWDGAEPIEALVHRADREMYRRKRPRVSLPVIDGAID
ncbi:MAG TPA: GGDEF domain-containing protein [Solirubrobacterales bacterium]|nr:GGDEF domain-containing protein [Solirubrobacterales bacterium]